MVRVQTMENMKQKKPDVTRQVKKSKSLPVFIVEQHNDVQIRHSALDGNVAPTSMILHAHLPVFEHGLGHTQQVNANLEGGDLFLYVALPWDDRIIVLPFIHRAIGSRQLPFSEIPFIHFDSHPDLLIPIDLDADTVQKPQQLYESISIENWVLPLSYAKHVNHIVWVKPPWAQQIKPSTQTFAIGKCRQSGKLRLSCKENYFLTDGLFCPGDRLENSSEVKLTVLELCPDNWSCLDPSHEEIKVSTKLCDGSQSPPDELFHSYRLWTPHLQSLVQDRPYVLDMDLDFFSTANPFKDSYSQTEERALRRLYRCPPLDAGLSDEDISTYTSLRHKQLLQLQKVFSSTEELWSQNTDPLPEDEVEKMTLSKITGASEEFLQCFNDDEKDDILSICQSLLRSDRKSRDVTFDLLHDFGCTLDDTELPHHISSDLQVNALEEALTFAMKAWPKPGIVTISRSSHDDYCPPKKVDVYQAMFLNVLKTLYGELEITEDY